MKEFAPREISRKNKMLFEKLNAGDTSAMAELLINNMDLVEHLVKTFAPKLKNSAVASEDDLRQEAMMAMVKVLNNNPDFKKFRNYSYIEISRYLDRYVNLQNKAEADLYYEAPIAPGLPRLKDVATDEKSEYDMMIDREYSNGGDNDFFLCADDRKFLNMISYASPKEIARALNIPENRLIAIHEDIKKSIIEQRASLLGFRFLADSKLKRLYLNKSHKPTPLMSEQEATICEFMINNSNNIQDVAEYFNISQTRARQILDKMARKSRHPDAFKALQRSKENESALSDSHK